MFEVKIIREEDNTPSKTDVDLSNECPPLVSNSDRFIKEYAERVDELALDKMNKDNQVEEMAKVIVNENDCIIPCRSCAYYEYEDCRGVMEAERLYNAGYRKADDVAGEIFEAFRDEMRSLIATSKELFNECEDDYYEGKKDAFFTAIIHLDELIKKKYTEDGE